LRILQVVHGFPPFNRAGAEIFAYGLSRRLLDDGHQVMVFHRVADAARPEYETQGAEVDGIPVLHINNTFRQCDRFERTYRNDAIDRAFGKLLDEFRPDVVHFHHVTCLSTNLIAQAHRRGIPIVYTLHDYWLICQRGQFLKRDLSVCPGQVDGECVRCLAWQLNLRGAPKRVAAVLKRSIPVLGAPRATGLKRLLKSGYNAYARAFFSSQSRARQKVHARMDHVLEMCSQVDRFVAPSRFLKSRFVEFGVPEERIVHSRYGFDTGYYAPRSRPPDGRVRFGYIGTWIPPKGVHVLIEAFNGIRDERASLHLYGHSLPYEGFEDYEEHLRSLVRSPRIYMEGIYENRDVGEILGGLDVLVVPSIWYENSPLTIQEAMLAELPVITSDLGGMAELIEDGRNGLTFRPRDADDLRAQMERLIRDEALRERLRPRAAEVKDLAASAAEHLQLYRELTGERRGPG